jgi:hypothetical protein
MDLALAIVGAELLLAAVVRRGLRSAHALVAAVLGGAAALVVLSMGVEYARYLYPVLLFETVCLGIAAGTAWDLLSGWVGRRGPSRARRDLSSPDYSFGPFLAMTGGALAAPEGEDDDGSDE